MVSGEWTARPWAPIYLRVYSVQVIGPALETSGQFFFYDSNTNHALLSGEIIQ